MRLSLRRRGEPRTGRILFPFLGTSISQAALEATLRIARAERASLIPAYLAIVPRQRSLQAPIPQECEAAMPLLEAIEHRARRFGVPVDSRIERGRTPRHALAELMNHERFDRIVVAAETSATEGFAPGDIAWLLENAPGEIVVVRPDATGGTRTRNGNEKPPDRLAT